ncbi:hypothetical protein Ancab_011892 [Ancistrocladus abbreviatus]
MADELVDEFYFSALHDYDELFPISDEKYAVELQLQEALISSAISSSSLREVITTATITSSVSGLEDWITFEKEAMAATKQEKGESSGGFCSICMDSKPITEIFRGVKNCCSYAFCNGCIGKYVAVKIQENISMVSCPNMGCKGVIEPEDCRDILPEEVFERWESALCESMILGSQKYFCPFEDCSALLVDDGGEAVKAAECPYCRRLFCAQCRVPWHGGIGCTEFQTLGKDEREEEDIMALRLAKEKQMDEVP